MRTVPLLFLTLFVWGAFGQTVNEICTAAQSAFTNGAITSDQRVRLAQALKPALDKAGGPIQCTIQGSTGPVTLWFVDVTAQQPFTFTSPNAPSATVTNWGTTIPVLASVATYPPNPKDLRWNWGCDTGFGVFIDRMTYAGVPVNNPNPVTFQVGPIPGEVEAVRVADGIGATGSVPLLASGGTWSQAANGGVVTVTSPKGVSFAGCVDHDHSPLGLLGLLGLIAIPVCCCCCLLPLIWFCLRRKKNINWCCPQQQQNCCGQPAPMEVQMLPVFQTAGDIPYY